MHNTKALRTVLTGRLATVCPRVYYAQAKSGTERPYLVYTLDTLAKEDGRETMELEINAVDYGTDTAPCEALADAVEGVLEGWHHLDEDLQCSAYPDRRQTVTEEDRRIIRRRLLVELHVYERS